MHGQVYKAKVTSMHIVPDMFYSQMGLFEQITASFGLVKYGIHGV